MLNLMLSLIEAFCGLAELEQSLKG